MQENIIYELLDEQIVGSLLANRLKSEVEIISIKTYKKHIWQTTYHIVFCYDALIDGKHKSIFVIAHDNEQRETVLKSLEYLINNGFSGGDYLVPTPLFYEKKYNAAFYYGLEGDNLYHYIKNNDLDEVESLVIKTAIWFSKLHSIKIRKGMNLNDEYGKIRTISPGADAVLNLVNINYPHLIHLYNEFYRFFIENEDNNSQVIRQTLIHGDAHPENVIHLNSKQIGVIDFVDMTIGDPARDIGTFLQQFEYMAARKTGNPQFVSRVQQLFLTTYLENANMKLTDELQLRIDLYFNWTAIRTATYFLMKHDADPDRALPLIEGVKNRLGL